MEQDFSLLIPSSWVYSFLLRWFSIFWYLFNMQVGYDKQGLPIGLQLIGRPWGEASMLRLATAVEVSNSLIISSERAILVSEKNEQFCNRASNALEILQTIYRKENNLILKHSSHVFQELCAKSKKRPVSFFDVLKPN